MSNASDRMPAAGPADSPLVAFGRRWPTRARPLTLPRNPLRRRHFALFALVIGFLVFASLNIVKPGLPMIGVMVLVFGVWSLVWWRLYCRPTTWSLVGELPAYSARVACVGQVLDLRAFARQGPIRDEFLEVFSSYAPQALRTRAITWMLPLSSGLVLAIVTIWAVGLERSVFGWAVGLLTSASLSVLLWPTILRITSGKLEILERTMLNTRTLTQTTFDLRQSAVLVDLNQEVVFIARDGRTHEVWIKSAADPHAIAAAILRAAVSTHVAPALPDDAIVG